MLQRVNPMFGQEVHDDIEAITAHVAGKGLRVPRLVRTRDEALDWLVRNPETPDDESPDREVSSDPLP